MSFNVKSISVFERQAKRLMKKFPSLKTELQELIKTLKDEPQTGSSIGNNCYKVRLAIASKGKGKSGGARIITHVHVSETAVYLLTIYDKSEQSDVSDNEVKYLLSLI